GNGGAGGKGAFGSAPLAANGGRSGLATFGYNRGGAGGGGGYPGISGSGGGGPSIAIATDANVLLDGTAFGVGHGGAGVPKLYLPNFGTRQASPAGRAATIYTFGP